MGFFDYGYFGNQADTATPGYFDYGYFGRQSIAATLSPDLFAAALDWFAHDSTMQTLFPGGFVSSRGGVAQEFPYIKFGWRKPQPSLSPEDEQYLITLAAYARDDDTAADVGQRMVAAFLDETRPPLVFTDKKGRDWRESARIDQEAIGPDLVDYLAAVDGQEDGYVWRYQVPIQVWVVPASE